MRREDAQAGAPDVERLLQVARTLAGELGTGHEVDARLDSLLERDLHLDSLARVELLHRVEDGFGVKLPEDTLGTAERLQDFADALRRAGVATPEAPGRRERPSQAAVEAPPADVDTLAAVLAWHADAHPDRLHVLLQGDDGRESPISYGALEADAAALAAGLQARGLAPGDTVALMLPTGRDYLGCFFGVLMAGGVPVPIYPPARMSQIEDHMRRHAGILANAQASLLLTVAEAKLLAQLLRAQVDSLRAVLTPDELREPGARPHAVERAPADIALLQYTSGSTGTPKGVILAHDDLLANIRAMGRAARVRTGDVYVSWLPLYHDMGLIASWLASAYFSIPLVLMSPLAFLARPLRWLQAIDRHRGTLSGAPNFAYELCLRRVDERDLEGLDLSSWRLAYNGAEPVGPATVRAFVQRFAGRGFRAATMAPVFGLAECAVGLTFPPPGRAPLIDRVQREVFERDGRAQPAAADEAEALEFVGCGQPLPGYELRIVDATGFEAPERRQGRLEFRGPSATRGYYRNPQQTAKLFHGDWLDTGDLAYLAGGELYLTGREKDLIIRGGRNIHPQELEQAVGAIAGIRRGCVAVFGCPDPTNRTERLVVLAETAERDAAAQACLRREIDARTLDVLGMPADDVMLVPPHTVLKTSSGKIRRAASRELYLRGGELAGQASVARQLALLALSGAGARLRHGLHAAGELLFAARAATVFGLLLLPTWLVVAVLQRPATAWAVARAGARLLLRLCGVRPQLHGFEHIPRGRPYLVVANHASYLDGLVLVACWPEPLCFVAKAEFRRQLIAGRFLTHLGADFVERFDLARGLEDTARLCARALAGERLMIFPEGTLSYGSGLGSFRLGAFRVAAQAGVPVVPVALCGTRFMLREGSRMARRGPLSVHVEAPVRVQGSGWQAELALRDAARAAILARCGEPDRLP